MQIFARKRWWLLAIPLMLVSFGLWRVKEARSYVPRTTPLYPGPVSFKDVKQLPIVWRDNGVWVLRSDSVYSFATPTQKSAMNWNRAPVALHFSGDDLNAVKTVGSDGREVLKVNAGTLELWRAGKKRVSRKTDPSKPSALAIAPDGSRWAIASHQSDGISPKDKTDFSFDGVTLWNAQSKSQIARLYAKLGNVTALEFSPDSQLLAAVAADGWAFIWNADDGKLVRKWRAHPWVAASLAWSPDGKTLATGANPRLGQAGQWTISFVQGLSTSGNGGGDIHFKGEQFQLITGKQNNLVINGQTDRSLRLWNVESGQMLRKWESVTGVCSAQFSPDGLELAVGTHGEAILFDAANLNIARRLPLENYSNWPASVAWAPDGKTLAVACAPELSLWRAH